MDLVSLGEMVLFVTPVAVELSVWRAGHGWDQPILMRVLWRGSIYLSSMKRAASSNSAVNDMIKLMIWERVRSGPLLYGMGTSS